VDVLGGLFLGHVEDVVVGDDPRSTPLLSVTGSATRSYSWKAWMAFSWSS
jgi:hypothetical protein